MTRIIKVLSIYLVFLLCSCEKDAITFQPTETSTQSNVTLTGIVTDVNNVPVPDVEVEYRGEISLTNADGIYEFQNVLVDSKHNSLQINKEGYFSTNKTFRTNRVDQLILNTQLIEKKFDHSFSTDLGGSVNIDMVTIDFRPNTIMFESNNDNYTGTVNVAIAYLNPTDPDISLKMPGDLSLLSSDDVLHKSISYGMVFVELQSPSGDKLQIKNGDVATLIISLPDKVLSTVPDKVVASHFNEKLGLWEDETTATLVNGKYYGEVTHFSCWSYNSSSPSVIITGRIVDELGQPVPGIYIQASELGDWSGGFGYSDIDGIFTGAVAKDVTLRLYVRTNDICGNTLNNLLVDEIGPFDEDSNIGDIIVDLSEFEFISVNATFINCDGQPVTNALVHVARSYFKITDGSLNVTVPVCNENSNYLLWAHDLDRDKVSERLPLIVGQNTYENIELCDIDAYFLEVIAPDLNFNFNTDLELVGIHTAEMKYISGIFYNEQEQRNNMIRLDYVDTNSNGFEEGTWSISGGQISKLGFPHELKYEVIPGQSEVTINEIGSNANGNFVKGSYQANFKDVNTNEVYEFYGNFNVRTN